MLARHAVLTPSKSSGPPQLLSHKRPASVTHLGSTLLQHRGRGSHLLSTGDPPLCFLTLTKCKSSNSFVLTFIQNAGGVRTPSRSLRVRYFLSLLLTSLLRYFDLPTAFLQRVDGIGGKVFKSLDQAAGPAHLHPINLCRSAEAEMDAHVVIGNVAGAAAHFVNKSARARFHGNASADAVAVGFDPNRPKGDPVVPVARVVDQKRRRSVHVADHRGHAAIIPQVADRQTARRTYGRDPGPRRRGNIREGSVAIVVIQNPGLLEIAAEMLAIHFRVDVAVGEEQIGPAVVVEIEKRDAPAEVLRVEPESRGKGFVVEGAVAIVAVERGGIVGEIGFEQIEFAVAVVVGNGRAHAGLLAPVVVESGAGDDGNVGERAVVIVVVKNAGGAVAGDINVRPAVVVVIKSGNAEGVMPVGLIDAGFGSDIFENAVAKIVIKNIFRPRQAAWAAHHRHAFPHAGGPLAGSGRGGQIEIDVVGDEQIELAVAVVVNKGAAGAPGFSVAGNLGFLADVGEGAVAVVVVEDVFAVVRDVEIFPAVVVVVADAYALARPGVSQAGFCGDVGESAVMVVAIEVARWGFPWREGIKRRAVHDKNVGPAVVVIVKDGDARSGGFDNVLFRVFAAENHRCVQPGLLRDIDKMRGRFSVGALRMTGGLGRERGEAEGQPCAKP